MSSLRSLVLLGVFTAAAGFHAAAPLLQPRAAPVALRRPALQLSATAAAAATAAPDDETRPQPALMPKLRRTAALVAGSVLLTPALALASSAAGEHLHLGQKIALFFRGTGLPDWAILVLVSMLPAVELRGGVPVGAWMGIPPLTTFVICVIGNMIPIAPTLLALRSDAVKKVAKPLLDRANKKLANLPTGQSRTLALALFVGVPAPGTGAWTGAIIAYLLDMPFGEAMATIFAGVALAGIIMTILTVAGKAGALVALAALCAFGGGAILSAAKKEGSSDESSE